MTDINMAPGGNVLGRRCTERGASRDRGVSCRGGTGGCRGTGRFGGWCRRWETSTPARCGRMVRCGVGVRMGWSVGGWLHGGAGGSGAGGGCRELVGVSAGFSHSCGVRSDGSLWCWGANGYGQLGNGTTGGQSIPTRVGDAASWVGVSAGFSHSCGVRSDGSLWCWGPTATASWVTAPQAGRASRPGWEMARSGPTSPSAVPIPARSGWMALCGVGVTIRTGRWGMAPR